VSTLVLKNLLAFEVGTISTLLEFTSVVIVSNFKMAQSVVKCFDFLLALSNLAVKLITIALKFFLLLRRFNNVVSLGVLSGGFDLTT
jgi:hypothetical protein